MLQVGSTSRSLGGSKLAGERIVRVPKKTFHQSGLLPDRPRDGCKQNRQGKCGKVSREKRQYNIENLDVYGDGYRRAGRSLGSPRRGSGVSGPVSTRRGS